MKPNCQPSPCRLIFINENRPAIADAFLWERSVRSQMESLMNKAFGFVIIASVLGLSTVAGAHTLRLQCKKITTEDVVCRAIASDGEFARDVEIQLLATTDYRCWQLQRQMPRVCMRSRYRTAATMSLLSATRPTSPVLPVSISGNRFIGREY